MFMWLMFGSKLLEERWSLVGPVHGTVPEPLMMMLQPGTLQSHVSLTSVTV